jgi:hypothetical protein
LLILDAFNSNSIPKHLLAKEAFEIYFRHLANDGTIAVHVSNQYLDLASMICALGETFGLVRPALAPRGAAYSECVVLSRNAEVRALFQSVPRPSGRQVPQFEPTIFTTY